MRRHSTPPSSNRVRSLGRRSLASAKVKSRSSIFFSVGPTGQALLDAASVFQPALGFDCRHASGSGGRDGLPEYRILNVAAGEDAGNAGACGIRLRPDVPAVIQINL